MTENMEQNPNFGAEAVERREEGETKIKKTRTSKPKVKTGCQTCK
jgi:hypothetical protein